MLSAWHQFPEPSTGVLIVPPGHVPPRPGDGILSMWLNGRWAVYKDSIGRLAAPNLRTWYAGASAQIFPVLMGVVNSPDYRAQQSYAAFNAAWQGWHNLSLNSQDPFPWCPLANAAAAMGDTARVGAYINTVQSKYGSGYPWPFYNAGAGWFLRANSYMRYMMGRWLLTSDPPQG